MVEKLAQGVSVNVKTDNKDVVQSINDLGVVIAGNSDVPVVSVVAGEEFSVTIGKYDDMQSGTVDGISATNSVVGDGVVILKGQIDSPCKKNITINGKRFSIMVLSEPDSSNVSAILN